MEERRSTPRRSRPTVYSGEIREESREARGDQRESGPAPGNVVQGRFAASREAGGEPEEPQKKKRKREQQAETKLRALWCVFGVLVVLLVAAIVYEIVLGNGTKETGAQRMERESRQERTVEVSVSAEWDEEDIPGRI